MSYHVPTWILVAFGIAILVALGVALVGTCIDAVRRQLRNLRGRFTHDPVYDLGGIDDECEPPKGADGTDDNVDGAADECHSDGLRPGG